mgnify:FL=1
MNKAGKELFVFYITQSSFFAWEPLRKKLCLGYNEIRYKKKY